MVIVLEVGNLECREGAHLFLHQISCDTFDMTSQYDEAEKNTGFSKTWDT